MSTPDFSELQFKPVAAEEQQTVHPWRRYFARSFDLLLFSFIAMIIVALPAYILAPDATDRILALTTDGWKGTVVSNVLGVVLALPLMALSHSIVGTPGKWLFGVRVRDAAGRRLSIGSSFKREMLVAVKGMGLGVPVVTSVLMIMANLRLTGYGVTKWDEQMRCHVTHAPMNAVGWIKACSGGMVVIGMLLYSHFSRLFAMA